MSLKQLSARTKIKVERLLALEAMEWEQLPTLVYLKGFLRAYAAEVQMDPDELTTRYLDELNELAPEYAEREAHPPPVPDEEFVVRESMWDRDPDYDDLYAMDVLREPQVLTGPQATPALRLMTNAPRKRITRYLAVAVVSLAALASGWIIGSNLRTTLQPFTTVGAEPHANEPAKETNEERLERARRRAAAAAAEMGIMAPLAASVPELVPVPLAEPAARSISPSTVEPGSLESKPRDVSAHDLSGWWALTTRFDSTTAYTLDELSVGFHLQLQQSGNRVTGTGTKWMEDGRTVRVASRIEIQLEGTLNGQRLELNVTERGTPGATAGKLVMNVTGPDTLRGRFVMAANARGTSFARRMEFPPQ